MPVAPPKHTPHAQRITQKLVKDTKRRQDGATYDASWRRLRARHVKANPLCVECLEANRVEPVAHVDHIIPVVKAPLRRLDPTNLQSLCLVCHSKKTAAENGGKTPAWMRKR